ncbi:FUSC family protein [Segnochrobactraceae bacterium EtOH-i3]
MTHAADGMPARTLPAFPVDLGGRNFVVSIRLAVAAITALALAYWLELQSPQWAILTVYLLTQPAAGAAIAKGVFRFLGTVGAAICGVIIVKLFSQDPVLLVGSASLWMVGCYYAATRLRNFTAYGFMLGGYTGLLIIFQGAADPNDVWRLAADRASEIGIGIVCAGLATSLVMPVYAGDQLRGLLGKTFSALAGFAATALTPGVPAETVMGLRRGILAKVVTFDALRSYTVFEARELRANDAALREVVREFLTVIAIARALHVRLAAFRGGEGGALVARLQPLLDETVALLDGLARNPALSSDLSRLRADLTRARLRLAALSREIAALAGAEPLGPLADAALILRRAIKLLRSLSLLALTEQAVFRRGAGGSWRLERRAAVGASDHHEAVLQGLRAGLAVLVLCLFWQATEWTQGMAGITGLALMSYQCVNTNDPGKLGWPYFRAVVAACVCSYLVMIFVYPRLEGFEMLAAFLLVVLVPLGLLIGTPRYAKTAGTFTVYFLASSSTANVFAPDSLTFINFCVGLVFGMAVCLVVARLIPVTSHPSRRAAHRRTVHQLLPEAATGHRPERRIARDVLDLIAALLPRLSLVHTDEDTFLRGMLACSSSALELGRLRHLAVNPVLPEAGRAALGAGLARLAGLLATLPPPGPARDAALADGRETVQDMWAALSVLTAAPGSAEARTVLDAAASLRFLSDRFELDQAFLDQSFGD